MRICLIVKTLYFTPFVSSWIWFTGGLFSLGGCVSGGGEYPDLSVGAGETGRAGVVEFFGLHLKLKPFHHELLDEGLDLVGVVSRERLV